MLKARLLRYGRPNKLLFGLESVELNILTCDFTYIYDVIYVGIFKG